MLSDILTTFHSPNYEIYKRNSQFYSQIKIGQFPSKTPKLNFMTNENIIVTIKQMTGFSDNELSTILKYFETKKIKKNTNLLEAGSIAKEVYFILSGCIRLFYEKNGEDISAYFFTEKMFAGAYDSFITQKPSKHCIETIEECHLMAIHINHCKSYLLNFPK